MKIAKINWHDARSIDGWCDKFDEELSLIQSCGYVTHENEEAIFLSASVSIDKRDGNQYACTIVIPKKMIVEINIIQID